MDNDLQFNRAEFAAPRATTCSACQAPLTTEYFGINGKVFCAKCAAGVRQYFAGAGAAANRFAMALLLGAGAAVLGSAVYAAVLIGSNSQWGIISIGIGWLVGKGVRKGSGNLGGGRFQVLAALLTYAAISGAFGANMVNHFGFPNNAADALNLVVAAIITPITRGIRSIFGIVIIAIGMWEAWKLNGPVRLEITGPHALGGPAPATDA